MGGGREWLQGGDEQVVPVDIGFLPEALPGHPLYRRGLQAYGVFEVRGSHWVRTLTEQNRVKFPSTRDSTQRHYVFTFHDSTFECIADGLRGELYTGPADGLLARIGTLVQTGGR